MVELFGMSSILDVVRPVALRRIQRFAVASGAVGMAMRRSRAEVRRARSDFRGGMDCDFWAQDDASFVMGGVGGYCMRLTQRSR